MLKTPLSPAVDLPALPAKPTPPPLHPRRQLLRRILVFGVLPVVALAGIAQWIVAPWFVRRHISTWFAARSYGRLEIRWASVGLRGIHLYGVSLTDRNGRVYGTADSVVVSLDRPIVGFGKPVVTALRINRPDISVTLDAEGQIDIAGILKRPPEAPSSNPDPVPPVDPKQDGNAPPAGSAPDKPLGLPATIEVVGGILRFNSPFLNTTFGTIETRIQILPDRYEWTAVEAKTLGGRASLSGYVSRAGHEGWAFQASVQDASVHEMTRGTSLASKRLEGRLNGFLSLGSTGGQGKRAIGAGWVDVDDGKLLELPVLLSVLNVLSLNLPGDSAVRAARTDFRILEERLHFDRFYVLTAGICLFGEGDVFTSTHELDLDFVPRLVGDLPLGIETVREVVSPATDLISKNLLVDVKVKGTWTAPHAFPLPVPLVTKRVTEIVEWLVGEQKKR